MTRTNIINVLIARLLITAILRKRPATKRKTFKNFTSSFLPQIEEQKNPAKTFFDQGSSFFDSTLTK